MPRRSRFAEGSGIFPAKSSQKSLNGTTYATLVASPPRRVSYVVTHVYGQNTSGGARTLALAFNDDGTRSVIWRSGSAAGATPDGECFTQSDAGGEIFELGLILERGETLDMKVESGACTDKMVASYHVEEAERE